MPIRSPLSLRIGAIIDTTLGVVERSMGPVLIYVAGLTAINAVATYLTLDMTGAMDLLVIALGRFAVSVGAAYLLLEAIVFRTDLRSRSEGDVFLAYVVLSILATAGFIGGLILFVIPGLVFMARWIIAAPMLVARGGSATKALGASWERTSGAEFQILIAMFALLLPLIAVIVACGILFDPADPVGIGISQLFTSATGVVTLAIGVALYGLIEGGTERP